MRRSLAFLALVGCSSFTATAPPAPTSDAGPADAGPGIGPSSSPDADTTPGDAATRYCASGTHVLCTDYEGVAFGDWAHAESDMRTTGTLEVIADSARDSSFGLHAHLPKAPKNGGFDEVLQAYQATGTADAFLEAWVRIRQPTSYSTGALTVLALQYPSQFTATAEAKLQPGSDAAHAALSLYARGQDIAGGQSATISVPYGTWLHVRIETRLVSPGGGEPGGSGTMTIAGYGAPLTQTVTRAKLDPSTFTRSIVGVFRYDNAVDADIDVDYDDITGGTL